MNVCYQVKDLNLQIARGEEEYVHHFLTQPVDYEDISKIGGLAEYIGVTDNFKKVIRTFDVSKGETPAGFKLRYQIKDHILLADLVRDISYDENNQKRSTNLLFSADSANPYEIEPIKDILANLTCNPGIIYDLFINNPEANIGHRFKTRDEVMAEIGKILGPGADISVELNDPFGKSDSEILEEAEKFREMLSEYRVVIKVPHTGPVNKDNVNQLLTGDKKLDTRYSQPRTADAFRGHRLALMLKEHGYRVNFTLMFETWQTALALQAKPYFINSFIRHRLMQSQEMEKYLGLFDSSRNVKYLEALRTFMIDKDYYSAEDVVGLEEVREDARRILKQRSFESKEGSDGLDGVRHNLRWLRQSNLEDTRLIICSMEGADNYPDIDRLLVADEFRDMSGRVVLTAEPNYLARFTSANQVVSYQRRFMNAADGEK